MFLLQKYIEKHSKPNSRWDNLIHFISVNLDQRCEAMSTLNPVSLAAEEEKVRINAT